MTTFYKLHCKTRGTCFALCALYCVVLHALAVWGLCRALTLLGVE